MYCTQTTIPNDVCCAHLKRSSTRTQIWGEFVPTPPKRKIEISLWSDSFTTIWIAKMKHWIIAVIFRCRNPKFVDWSMRNRTAKLKILLKPATGVQFYIVNIGPTCKDIGLSFFKRTDPARSICYNVPPTCGGAGLVSVVASTVFSTEINSTGSQLNVSSGFLENYLWKAKWQAF